MSSPAFRQIGPALSGDEPGYRVLIIDDNRAIHEDIRKILGGAAQEDTDLDATAAALFDGAVSSKGKFDLEIDSAFQGHEGLELVQQALAAERPYALAFVDVRMPPGWDGIETISRLWQVQPDLQVVICTAYSDYSWDEMITKLGQTDSLVILKKPFDNIEVLQLAHTLTHKWTLSRRLQSHLAGLDQMVACRTEELELANARLRQEMEDREAAQKQLRHAQKMEALGQFAAGVAHDFNNLLTVIQGYASMQLATPDLAPDMTDSLEQVALAADRASALTRQLLLFSRQQVAQPRLLDCSAVVGGLRQMLGRVISEEIELRCDLAADLPAVHADPGNLEQILMNLVVNARDAMPDGGRIVIRTGVEEIDAAHIARSPQAQPGSHVCLSVSDTGAGMSEETMSRIFEPFFTTKAAGQGTGLGLATVYGLVAQHGGWLELNSKLGEGTTFRIFLPASELPAEGGAEPVRPELRGGGETILVVEDERAVREIVSYILRQSGYAVLEASDGPEALSVWAQKGEEIDLLLTDVVMPNGLRGNQLADRLRTDRSDLRVLFSTGYDPDFAHSAAPLPARMSLLEKPYRPDTLVRAVRDCLDA